MVTSFLSLFSFQNLLAGKEVTMPVPMCIEIPNLVTRRFLTAVSFCHVLDYPISELHSGLDIWYPFWRNFDFRSS
jgi:hypothetical protein